jgi:hypothetical protein
VIGSKSGKKYRIWHGVSRNVTEINENGRTVAGRCFMPKGNLVAADCVLAQKIILENCEDHALGVALRF